MARAGKDHPTSRQAAEIVREYGPFPGSPPVHGVTFDGKQVWFAAGDALRAFDPASGKAVRAIDVAADAGTAFDGRYLYQLAGDRIQKIDSATGAVVDKTRGEPAPGTPGALTEPRSVANWMFAEAGRAAPTSSAASATSNPSGAQRVVWRLMVLPANV